MLNRVTITGADNSVNPEQLLELSKEYPFVEWAILVAANRECERYPSQDWIRHLSDVAKSQRVGLLPKMNLAVHICGSWIRDLVIKVKPTVFEQHPEYFDLFPRVQLNFSPYDVAQKSLDLLAQHKNQFIFQINKTGVSDKERLARLGLSRNIDIAVLFDKSGGKGVVPTNWRKPFENIYCGFAGGLGPLTLAEELPKIFDAAGDIDFWIDMESRVRSEDNKIFDLDKVKTCLEICKPFVNR